MAMFRFLALSWNVDDPGQNEMVRCVLRRVMDSVSRWQEVFQGVGLRVFCAGIVQGYLEPLRLADQRGVVLGTLFERNRNVEDDSLPKMAVLSADRSELLRASAGRRLIEDYWGN